MKKIFISEDAFGDLNDGFLFYEAQDFGLGDYFTACLRASQNRLAPFWQWKKFVLHPQPQSLVKMT
jgi:hypothetical protein